ncbi:PEPxxWA-CTERM sorting domain-containing protein [Sandarakinorhabdus sp. DWP1-3-1]|uniref:PEPxxWA-CTERM sorting domain-containing protein n=1 Tax=Sandarakinorhabdus sp. DWP1-3-1 TaxID=2804627 RepID=UPI003CFA396D
MHLVLGLALFGTTAAAEAAVLASLDRATFQAAIAGVTTLGVQDFDSLVAGSELTSDGAVQYGASTGTPLVTSTFLTSTGANGLGRTGVGFFLAADTASFTFGSAITAFAIDINTFAPDNGAYSVTLNTGDTSLSIFETFPGRGTGQFIGFVSTLPFTTVTLQANSGFAYTLDTLIYGAASEVVGGVPEPASWTMLILGFTGVGAVLRRRRASAAALQTG